MQERAFSLLEEPWISVMRMDHHVTKVSLLQALLQAHEIRDLAGESKTQDCAIFRLLLAVVYREIEEHIPVKPPEVMHDPMLELL